MWYQGEFGYPCSGTCFFAIFPVGDSPVRMTWPDICFIPTFSSKQDLKMGKHSQLQQKSLTIFLLNRHSVMGRYKTAVSSFLKKEISTVVFFSCYHCQSTRESGKNMHTIRIINCKRSDETSSHINYRWFTHTWYQHMIWSRKIGWILILCSWKYFYNVHVIGRPGNIEKFKERFKQIKNYWNFKKSRRCILHCINTIKTQHVCMTRLVQLYNYYSQHDWSLSLTEECTAEMSLQKQNDQPILGNLWLEFEKPSSSAYSYSGSDTLHCVVSYHLQV